jgi:hypothetical protein
MDRDVPIILFTLHADMISPSEARETGITAVVSKMDKISELSRQVEYHLHSARYRAIGSQASSQP